MRISVIVSERMQGEKLRRRDVVPLELAYNQNIMFPHDFDYLCIRARNEWLNRHESRLSIH